MESSNYRDGAYTGGPLNDIRERFRESSLGRDVLKRVVSVIYGSKLPVSVRENRDVLIELIVKGIVHIGVAFFVGCQTKTLLPRTAQVLGIEGDRPMAVKGKHKSLRTKIDCTVLTGLPNGQIYSLNLLTLKEGNDNWQLILSS